MSLVWSSGTPDLAPRTNQAPDVRGGRKKSCFARISYRGLKNRGKPTTDERVSTTNGAGNSFPLLEERKRKMKIEAKRATQAGKTTAVAVAIVSVGLLLTLLVGGFGSDLGAAGTEQNAGRTERPKSGDTPTDRQSTYTVRPHPRGLPRRGAQVRRNRRYGLRGTRRKVSAGARGACRQIAKTPAVGTKPRHETGDLWRELA
jgi:hypothetical protein